MQTGEGEDGTILSKVIVLKPSDVSNKRVDGDDGTSQEKAAPLKKVVDEPSSSGVVNGNEEFDKGETESLSNDKKNNENSWNEVVVPAENPDEIPQGTEKGQPELEIVEQVGVEKVEEDVVGEKGDPMKDVFVQQ